MPLLRNPQGHPVWVPDDQVSHALSNGYEPETSGQAAVDLTQKETSGGGVAGGAIAGLTSALSGATLGGSDVLLSGLLNKGGVEGLAQARAAHPYISTAGTVGGALLSALLSGGATAGESAAEGATDLASIMRATPAAQLSRIGGSIAELGEGAGAIGKATASAGAAALEGAAQNAGAYVSDVALGDRDLSIDGFMGAMGKGALWGGVAGGALSLASNGLVAARRLFPRAELTEEAVAKAEGEATDAIKGALDDGETLETSARSRMQDIREQHATSDLETARELNRIKVARAQQAADAQTARFTEKAAAARTKPAMDWLDQFRVDTDAPAAAAAPSSGVLRDVAGGDTSLLEQLQGTKSALDTGMPFAQVAEDHANEVLAKVDPEVGALHSGVKELADARAELASWLEKQGATASKAEPAIGTGPSLADKIASGEPAAMTGADLMAHPAPPTAPIEEQLAKVLTGKTADVNADIAEAAPIISRYEAAHAQLTEALGPKAPTSAQQSAAAFRQAQGAAEHKTADAAAGVADQLEKGAAPAAAAAKRSLLGRAADSLGNAGAQYEALRHMGIPLPDPRSIPVIGPLLSMFLRAKVVGKAFGRFGGKVAETAESTIASKAAATKNRINAAIDTMLDVSGKATAKAAPIAGGAAAALGHTLFDDRAPARKPYSSQPAGGALSELYQARAAELEAAQRPGAIADAVKQRVQTSDPTIVDSIVAAQQRKLGYLYQTMPKPDAPPATPPTAPWSPSRAELVVWSHRVAVAEDPASVLETVAKGGIPTSEAIETLRAIYPALYAQGQRQVVEKLVDLKKPLPYRQRLAVATLWGVPLDASMTPEHASFLQSSYTAPRPAPSSPQPAPAPMPTISAPINSGQREMTRLDRS